MFLAKCFAGLEFLSTSLCSSHLILQFLIVSPTFVFPHEQIPLEITQLKCWTYLLMEFYWILCVFQATLNLNFPLVKETNLLIKYVQYFSFFEENGKRIATCFLSSNNHSSIRSSSFLLVKFLIVFSIKCFRYPASVYLFLILFVLLSKFEAVLLALCSSPAIVDQNRDMHLSTKQGHTFTIHQKLLQNT